MATKILATPPTAQSIGSLLKSERDIMRKDKGLNGDLDRLPLLTWSGRLCLGLKARTVIAWAGASLRAEAQVTFQNKYPQPCKGETPPAPCLNPLPTS